jgi:hypothetical protein
MKPSAFTNLRLSQSGNPAAVLFDSSSLTLTKDAQKRTRDQSQVASIFSIDYGLGNLLT